MRIFFVLFILLSNFHTTIVEARSLLTFKQSLILAYKNSPQLQAEIKKADVFRGHFIQSKQYPNPEVSLTAENIGGSGLYSGYESAETTLAISQPIPLGNRLNYLQKATYADYLTSIAQIKHQKSMLFISIGNAYIDALYADQWHQVTKKLIRLNEDIVEAIQRRVEAGAGSNLDLHLAKIRLGETRIQENKAAANVTIQRANLTRLLGDDGIIQQELSDVGLHHLQWKWSNLNKKIEKSPEIQVIQEQLKAKRAGITATKKAVWPDLVVQLGGRHFSDDGSNAAVISTASQLPVYDRNQGKIMAAEAEYSQTLHELRATKLDIKQLIYAAFLQTEQSRFEADLVTNSMLPLARKSLTLAKEGYQQGRYTYLELYTALSNLIEEERHYQEAHANFHKALIQIDGLIGLDDPR